MIKASKSNAGKDTGAPDLKLDRLVKKHIETAIQKEFIDRNKEEEPVKLRTPDQEITLQ